MASIIKLARINSAGMNGMVLKMGASALKTKLEEQELNIDWEDYNYPYGLRLIHYMPMELKDKEKILVANIMHIAFLTIIPFYLLNCLTNLMAFIYMDPDITVLMPIYSLFHLLIALPIGMAVFSRGYRALAGISDERTYYKFGEIFMMVFMAIAFTFQLLCYHGIRTIMRFKEKVNGLVFTFGLIEEGILLGQIILRAYCLYVTIYKYPPPKSEDDD
jgi:hypothetical protein